MDSINDSEVRKEKRKQRRKIVTFLIENRITIVMEDIEEIIESVQQSTFHMSDEEAKPIIDEYLKLYPMLLNIHDKEWYYKYC